MSPELVLVDPGLAMRARHRLVVPERCEPDRRTCPPPDTADAFFVHGPVRDALRRIAAARIDGDEEEPVAAASHAGPRLAPRALPALMFSVAVVAVAGVGLLGVGSPGTRGAAPSAPVAVVASSAPVAPAAVAHVRGAPARTLASHAIRRPVAAPAQPSAGRALVPRARPSTPSPVARRKARTVLALERTVAAPRPSSASTRAPRRRAARATRLVWDAAPRASSYRIELVRGRTRIFVARSVRPRVSVPRTWTFGGSRWRLRPEDQAYVWPVVAGRRAGRPIVDGVLALDLTPIARFAG